MRLIIDNTELDLSPDTVLDYNQSSSIFNALKGDYSYPYDLPGTAKNLQLFGNPHLPTSGADVQREFQGELWIGSFLFGKGIIRLRNTKVSRNGAFLIVNLEFAPANIPKKIWQKNINTFDFGSETIPVQTIQAKHYWSVGWSSLGMESNVTSPDYRYYQCLVYVDGQLVVNVLISYDTISSSEKNMTKFKNDIADLFSNVNVEGITIISDNSKINIKVDKLATEVKVLFTGALFVTGPYTNFGFHQFSLINFTTINQTYFDSKIDNSIYCLPEIINQKFYTGGSFNGVINKKDGSHVMLNSDEYQSRYCVVPHLKFLWVFQKLSEFLNLDFTGAFFSNSNIQKLIFHNLFATDKQAAETTIPFNVHSNTITYANHLPEIKLGEFFQALVDEFGIGIEFNTLTQTADFFFFNEVLQSNDFIDLSGRLAVVYESEVQDIKKKQMVWEFDSADEIAKNTIDIFKPMPADDVVEADSDFAYDDIKGRFPSLLVETELVGSEPLTFLLRKNPQIKQTGISVLYSQTKNKNPLRFLFWENGKADSQTDNLSLSFYGENNLYDELLSKKLAALNNNKPFKRKALLSLTELMSFRFKTKIFADGIWYLADNFSVKLRKEQAIYEVEFLLRRLLF